MKKSIIFAVLILLFTIGWFASGQIGKIRDELDIAKKFNLGSDGWESIDNTLSRVSQPAWAEV